MSYVVTSSKQQQYGGLVKGPGGNPTRVTIGLENPSKFQNHFTSPLEIKPNSEIAVESVKISRAPVFDIEDNSLFFSYWGLEQTDAADGGPDYRNSMPIPVRVEPGSYGVQDFRNQIQTRLNESYRNPDIFGQTAVTDITNASGAFQGFSALTTQRGSASLAAKDASGSAVMSGAGYWQNPNNITRSLSAVTVALVGTDTRLTRISPGFLTDEELDDGYGQWIGGGLPIGLVNGHFECNTVNSALGGWRCGLSRPQIEFRPIADTVQKIYPGGGERSEWGNVGQSYPTHNPVPTLPGNICRDQTDYYDYMVQDDGTDVSIYHSTWDSLNSKFVMQEVKYYHAANPTFKIKLTSAAYNASFDRVIFTTVGDELTVAFGNIGLATYFVAVEAAISTIKWRCCAPIGETRNCLYPKITIGEEGDYLTVTRYDSHYTTLAEHKYPEYILNAANPAGRPGTLITGDSFFVNNRIGRATGTLKAGTHYVFSKDARDRPYCLSQTRIADQKWAYDIENIAIPISTDVQTFVGTRVGGTGIDYNHVWLINDIERGAVNDYVQGKYAKAENENQPNMSRLLGFDDQSVLSETDVAGYVGGAAGLAVSFNSFGIPQYRAHSCFVRVSNLGQISYNGAKQSISKILYHLPRFSNEGREFGDLYYSPGEKTYIKLNNTDKQLLNNIEVQIVDVNEKPVTDLNGNTIVCFHIRQN